MTIYGIKPQFVERFGRDASPYDYLTEQDVEVLARGWNMTVDAVKDQLWSLESEDIINLHYMTDQESGIIVYSDREAVICNWAAEAPCGGFPKLLGDVFLVADNNEKLSLMSWEKSTTDKYVTNDVTVIYDRNGDEIPVREGLPCRVYHMRGNITVLAPEDWN